MRKTQVASVIGLALGVVLLPATAARASEHAQRINEVMLSFGANPAAQFIELKDSGEPFPNPPYKLQAYDAAGSAGTSVTLNGGNGGSALNDWTVMSTEAETALGATGSQPASALGLDATNGQVCFGKGMVFSPITCVNWGTVGTPITGSGISGRTHVPTPPDGQSVQLCSGTYILAAPTPKAANNCPSTGGGGGGGGGSTPGANPPQAGVAPDVKLTGSTRQKLGKTLSVKVSCHDVCLASASGTLSVPGTSKTFKIKSDPVQIAHDATSTLKLKLSKKARNAAQKALRKHRKVKAKLTITAKNTAGSDTAKRTVSLKK